MLAPFTFRVSVLTSAYTLCLPTGSSWEKQSSVDQRGLLKTIIKSPAEVKQKRTVHTDVLLFVFLECLKYFWINSLSDTYKRLFFFFFAIFLMKQIL